ncbi:MAG: hypothetical protein NTV86_15390 [Planctomycetota bacterium]|nr:hypothetical protein [Planctomycetota bacterium]
MLAQLRFARLLGLLLAGCLTSSAAAAESLWAVEASGGSPGLANQFLVGWQFTLSSDAIVDELGVFDIDGLGSDGRSVGLYSLTGASPALAIATIAPGTPGQAAGGYQANYVPITPVRLIAGNSYIVAAQVTPSDNVMFPTATFGTGITWQGAVQTYPMMTDLPKYLYLAGYTVSSHFTNGFLGPTFKYALAPSLVTLGFSQTYSRTVVQRDNSNHGQFTFNGTYTGGPVDRLEARVVARTGYAGTSSDWVVADAAPGSGKFSAKLSAAGGWYDVEVRAIKDGSIVGASTIQRVGVGEIFVTAGQSNSCNFGSPTQQPKDDRVNALSYTGAANLWQTANDPQPNGSGGGGSGGSPWPAMGDLLADRYGVPIGIVSTGYGGTTVGQWQPGGGLYANLKNAISKLGPGGFRAVLWHQGESDASGGTSAGNYAQLLENVIAQSRADAGFEVPWGVALASYLPGTPAANMAQVIAGQHQVIDTFPDVFLGSSTDNYHNLGWVSDGIHFNDIGLKDHGRQWADAFDAAGIIVPEPTTVSLLLLALPLLRRRRS